MTDFCRYSDITDSKWVIKKKHLVLLNFLTGLNLEVELLVRAHECHTLACNMEGIAAVLRNGRLLTTALAETREYMLMVTSYSVPWNIKLTKFNDFVNFASLVQRFVKVIIRLRGCYPTLLVFVSWIGLWETDYQTKLCTISPDSWLAMFFLLQVRLLTGIARFHEMSYIFDTLFEHEHFELLCRRGIDKVTLFCHNQTFWLTCLKLTWLIT